MEAVLQSRIRLRPSLGTVREEHRVYPTKQGNFLQKQFQTVLSLW